MPDLLDVLLGAYREAQPGSPNLDEFLAFGRQWLAKNAPVSMRYGEAGLSFQLPDGSLVPLTSAVADPMAQQPGDFPGMGLAKSVGGSPVQVARSWPIFGEGT